MAHGKFITLEGGEGAGKSTQIALLADGLRAAGIDVVATREPGGAPGAEDIRGLLVRGDTNRWTPLAEALLHTAARVEHVDAIIRPTLASGTWIACDRFSDSTMAYQGDGLGLGRDRISALQSLTLGEFSPDLTLILDIDVETGLSRAKSRAMGHSGVDDRYERMGRDFHQRLRDSFLDIAKHEPDRCTVIDATQPVSILKVAIRKIITERFGVIFR
jgi:dTMP kinase